MNSQKKILMTEQKFIWFLKICYACLRTGMFLRELKRILKNSKMLSRSLLRPLLSVIIINKSFCDISRIHLELAKIFNQIHNIYSISRWFTIHSRKVSTSNETQLTFFEKVKYFGVIIDQNLNWNSNINNIISKATDATWICRRIFGKT